MTDRIPVLWLPRDRAPGGLPLPSGCLHCGIARWEHGGRRWTAGVGFHPYVPPTPGVLHERARMVRYAALLARTGRTVRPRRVTVPYGEPMNPPDRPKRFTTDEQLDNWTAHHPPGSADVAAAHDRVRRATRERLDVFQEVIPEGPDKTVALRAAQHAMWAANSAIACNHPDNQ